MCTERLLEAGRQVGAHPHANLVAIGTASPGVAKALATEIGFAGKGRMLCDLTADADTFVALGAAYSVTSTFVWKRWTNVLGLLAFPYQCCCKGRSAGLKGATRGNAGLAFQQGGIAIVSPGTEDNTDITVQWRSMETSPVLVQYI